MKMYTRPLKLRMGLLSDMREMKMMRVNYIPSEQNISDIFTKVLTPIKMKKAVQMLAMDGMKEFGMETETTKADDKAETEERESCRKEEEDKK